MTATVNRPVGVDQQPETGALRAAVVRVAGLRKVHGHGKGSVLALDGLDLRVAAGEVVCLVGASGCGKSTLLSILAGLDEPTTGTVEVDEAPALLFQDAALFPWLSVANNVELALRLRGVGKKARREETQRLLAQVRLTGFEGKHPHELSGGMRQRAGLARALAQGSKILLLDEPFGALDAITRDLLHDELERVVAETGLAAVFVTHNVREAVRLGDRVLVLSSRPGRVVAEHEVHLPRPRQMNDPAVATLAGTITEDLRREVAKHG